MVRWASEAASRACTGVAFGNGHSIVLSGELTWCTDCGHYADAKAVGLSLPCKGPPNMKNYGGMAGQLRKLQRGRHPRTGMLLPPPVDESGMEWTPGPSHVQGSGTYANLSYYRNLHRWGGLQAALAEPVAATSHDDPWAKTPRYGTPPRSAREKMQERLIRIRAKEALAKQVVEAASVANVVPVIRRRCSTKRAAGW